LKHKCDDEGLRPAISRRCSLILSPHEALP
jgi:hypothetical protein